MPEQNEKLSAEEALARLALSLGLRAKPWAFYRVLSAAGSAAAAFGGLDWAALGLGLNFRPLLTPGLFEEAKRRLDEAAQNGWRILIWGQRDYPFRLTEVLEPPPVLWVKGRLEERDRFAVALVGSRRPSSAALATARRLGREGAAKGLTIVSGLAKGVDAASHRGALEAGGRTLAVLGYGLRHIYPRENADLYAEIPLSGALVSEFPPETRPLPALFPQRNRTIAALSLAVVIVEAGEYSGALITARQALELNREVMAVPGPAGAAYTRGGHKLIKDGAALVENMDEIVAELRPRLLEGLKAPQAPGTAAPVAGSAPGAAPSVEAPAEPKEALTASEPSEPEARLLAALAGGPLDMDSLVLKTGLEAADCAALLLQMELSGHIERLLSGHYGRK